MCYLTLVCVAAKTLGQLDCPVLHISGESHLFSCYDLGENVRSGGLTTKKKIAGNGAVVLSNKVLETFWKIGDFASTTCTRTTRYSPSVP